MGTGDRIALEINAGKYSKSYVFSHTDPYTTIDGVARTSSITYRISRNSSPRRRRSRPADHGRAAVVLPHQRSTNTCRPAYPPTRTPMVVSARVQRPAGRGLGSSRTAIPSPAISRTPTATAWSIPWTSRTLVYGTNFYTYELTAGWNYDARNRALFADRGLHLSVSGRYTIPPSDVALLRHQFPILQYVPIWRKWLLSFNAQVDYASALGRTTALPPYLNYFAVRAGQHPRLSREPLGAPGQYRPWATLTGGNFRVVNRLELIFPGARKVEKRRPGELVL